MKLYRFSPITDKAQLLEAVNQIHLACFALCKQSFGHYLPVAGNMGVFCHYDSEYEYLVSVRKEMTEESDNINQKYFKLHQPIVIPSQADVPETIYTHLYIRRPDPYRAQMGDVDFVLGEPEYSTLKSSILNGANLKGARVFDRPDLDMIELFDPDIDALGYVSPKAMTELVRTKQSDITKL